MYSRALYLHNHLERIQTYIFNPLVLKTELTHLHTLSAICLIYIIHAFQDKICMNS
jgi:hypothetical protein